MSTHETSNYRKAFSEEGFVVVRKFLSGPPLRKLTDALDRYYKTVVPTLPPEFAYYEDAASPNSLRQLNNPHLQDPFFLSLLGAEPWASLAEEILGEEADCCGMQVHDKPPGFPYPTPPHQDNSSMALQPPNAAAMWLAIDQSDEENGCLRYVRGSHRTGLRPHITAPVVGFCRRIEPYLATDRSDEVPIYLNPGDLVAHHPLTIHRTGINTTDRHRRAFLQLFRGNSCEYDESALAEYEAAVESNRELNRNKNLV